MRRKLLPTLLLTLLLLLTIGLFLFTGVNKLSTAAVPTGETREIVLNENGFSPSEITIKHGDSIKFTTTTGQPFWPASDLHPTHGIYPEFDPLEPVDADKSWTLQFLKNGKWKFHDHLQPISRGVVIVR